jgi:hypothetical protein
MDFTITIGEDNKNQHKHLIKNINYITEKDILIEVKKMHWVVWEFITKEIKVFIYISGTKTN